MAYPTPVSHYTRSVVATGAVAARRFATVAGAQAAALGAKVYGVNRYAVAVADAATVDVLGSALVEAGAAITLDADLTTDAQGRAVPITDSATQHRAGRSLSTAAAAGGLVEILLTP